MFSLFLQLSHSFKSVTACCVVCVSVCEGRWGVGGVWICVGVSVCALSHVCVCVSMCQCCVSVSKNKCVGVFV